MERVTLEISWGSLWRVLFFILLAVIMFFGRQILLGLFLAIVISSGLDRFISFLESRGLPRVLSVILVFVFGISFIVLTLYSVVPLLVTEMTTVIGGLNTSIRNLGFGPLVDPTVLESINALIARISSTILGDGPPLQALSRFLGGVGLALTVFISSFYLSISRDGVERFIKAIFPTDYEPMALRVYERSRRQIGLWFQTQILLSVVIGGLVWAVLTVLGVKHAFLLGLLAALIEIVPYIGPIISGAAAVLVALGTSLTLALYTLLAFLAIQQFENHILVPLFTKKAIGLHPVIVIISLLIGVETGGFLGMLIAVPAAAVFQEILEEWSTKKKSRAAAA